MRKSVALICTLLNIFNGVALGMSSINGAGIGQSYTSSAPPMPVTVILSGQSPCLQNTTCAFSASGGTAPYTYSLGAGSLGSINATNGGYTAPAKVTPNQTYGGCQVLPNNHILNTRVDSLPIHPQSATWLASIVPGHPLNYEIGFVGQQVKSTDPTTAIGFQYTTAANGPFRLLGFPKLFTESGEEYNITQTDHHVIPVTELCGAEELYQFYPAGWNLACLTCRSQSGTAYPLTGFTNTQGADAAGLPLLPLVLRADELTAGAINHALRFILAAGSFDAASHVWPATANTTGTPNPNKMPYGTRLRLKASFTLDPTIDGLCPTAACQALVPVIILALKLFGLVLADAGSNGAVTVMSGGITVAMQAAFAEIAANIDNHSQFEVVQAASLQTAQIGSGMDPFWFEAKNAAGHVVIIATDAHGNAGQLSIALQGVAMAVPHAYETIQAGSAAKQLSARVSGSTDKTVTWSLTPSTGAGTLTAGGLYTAPATVAGRTAATATATSNADGTVSATAQLTILPTGIIRIGLGANADYTDGASNTWLASQLNGVALMFDNGLAFQMTPTTFGRHFDVPTPPGWLNAGNSPSLYDHLETNGSGGTLNYYLSVPNGAYTVELWFADTQGAKDRRNFGIDIQGTVTAARVDPFVVSGAAYTAFKQTATATVTDGTLTINLRTLGVAPTFTDPCCGGAIYNIGSTSMLSGMTVTPQ